MNISRISRNTYKEYEVSDDYEKGYQDGFDDGFDTSQIMLVDRAWIFDLCDAVAYVVKEKRATREEDAYMVDLNYKRLMSIKKDGIDLDTSLFEEELNNGC